jgi:hypothetical protein
LAASGNTQIQSGAVLSGKHINVDSARITPSSAQENVAM